MDQSDVTFEALAKDLIDTCKALQANLATIQTRCESIISFRYTGEKPTTQGYSLPAFSVGKAQDPNNPRKHVAAESSSSTGERPTAKAAFLPNFSAEKAQYPSHIKFEPTPHSRPNSLIADQSQEPNFGGGPTQYGLPLRIQLGAAGPTYMPRIGVG